MNFFSHNYGFCVNRDTKYGTTVAQYFIVLWRHLVAVL